MNTKRRFDDRNGRRMTKFLDDCAIEQPSSGFADRVVGNTQSDSSRDALSSTTSKSAWKPNVHNEVTHFITAAACTYLFIESGILNRLATLDSTVSDAIALLSELSRHWIH